MTRRDLAREISGLALVIFYSAAAFAGIYGYQLLRWIFA